VRRALMKVDKDADDVSVLNDGEVVDAVQAWVVA
jgi:hypothetical protein